jgi:hypothetical protein
MDAETGAAAAAGIVAGGGLVSWFAKAMFDRLIRQLDDVTKEHVALDKVVSTSGAHLMATVEKTDRISGAQARTAEKLESVSARVEGLSASYGPKLAEHSERLTRLESERFHRRDDE